MLRYSTDQDSLAHIQKQQPLQSYKPSHQQKISKRCRRHDLSLLRDLTCDARKQTLTFNGRGDKTSRGHCSYSCTVGRRVLWRRFTQGCQRKANYHTHQSKEPSGQTAPSTSSLLFSGFWGGTRDTFGTVFHSSLLVTRLRPHCDSFLVAVLSNLHVNSSKWICYIGA